MTDDVPAFKLKSDDARLRPLSATTTISTVEDFPDIQLRAQVNFPGSVYGGTGIDVEKTGGSYYINLDYSEFAAVPAAPANTYTLYYDPIADSYVLAPPIIVSADISTTIIRNDIPFFIIEVPVFTAGGYYAAGDLGTGAMYTSVGASSTSIGAIQDNAGTWFKLVINENVNVGWFGARGNGTTDDTVAIQAAIDAAAAIALPLTGSYVNPSVEVLFPVKSFVCGELDLRFNVLLRGAADGGHLLGTKLICKPGAAYIMGGSLGGSGAIGFSMYGLGASGTEKGIWTGGDYGVFSSNFFDNFGGEALWLTSGLASTVADNLAINCLLNHGAVAANTGVFVINGTDHTVRDNEVTPSISALVSGTNQYIAAIYVPGTNCWFRGNVAEISECGFRITGSLNRFSNDRSDLNYGNGFINSGGANQFSNCLAINNSRAGANVWSGYVTSGGNNLYSNCVDTCTSGGTLYGFEDTVFSDSNKNIYTHCLGASATKTFGVASFAGAAVTVISGQDRLIANGDTTPWVDNYENWRTENSAPTTITNFDSGTPGQKLTIHFADGNTSIADGSGIVTPGYTTVGPFAWGDVATLVNSNGTWFFTSVPEVASAITDPVWVETTPTPTAVSGTLTAATAVLRERIDGTLCSVMVQVTVTNFGTGTVGLNVTLPTVPQFNTAACAYDNNSPTNNMVAAVSAGGVLSIYPTSGTLANHVYWCSATYQVA